MSALEFGIFDSFGPFETDEFPTVVEVYEAHIREAQEAEQLGHRYYVFIEHQNSLVCAVTAPNIYLTALSSPHPSGPGPGNTEPALPRAAGIRHGHRSHRARVPALEPVL